MTAALQWKMSKESKIKWQGNLEADVVANLGAAEHKDPGATTLLCERPEVWPRVWLPMPEPVPPPAHVLPAEMLPQSPTKEVNLYKRVVEYIDFARCLDCCFRQMGRRKKSCNYFNLHLRRQGCRPLRECWREKVVD
eukprot:6471254-Amphidinium_carterae.1